MPHTPTLANGTEFASALPGDPLWPRLAAFRFDAPGASLPFTARLARDQGWSLAYARRVVDEYRRFVFVSLRAGHPCTPSVDVDEAWHLHLLYTDSYWVDFCGDTLGRPLHHGPTRGGRADAAKHTDQYARTLASYETVFGAAPPADIWPPAGERMAAAQRPRVVRSATHWVVRKPAAFRTLHARLRTSRAWTLALCVAALLATVLVARAATVRAQAPNASRHSATADANGGGGGGVVFAVVGGFMLLVLLGSGSTGGGDGKGGDGDGGGASSCGCGGC
jgi:hypothetical protein